MQFDELRFLVQQAALDLVGRGRPVTPTVVLPGPTRTLLLGLPDLPDEDEARHAVLLAVAATRVTAAGVPCWGFVAEADVAGSDGVLVAYGARRHAPELTAARFDADDVLDAFLPAEALDPTALPFLHPLQHAVDALAGVGDAFAELDPKRAGPVTLPLVE
jgi:hypothetical protein